MSGQPVMIDAQMAALELSYDRDWVRFRASLFFASGDSNPYDDHGRGFDTILDDPNFAGGDFSFWQRQPIKLLGVNLKQADSLVPDLRAAKAEGQANFVNPGLELVNFGMDFEPDAEVAQPVTNANLLWFYNTAVIEHRLSERHSPVYRHRPQPRDVISAAVEQQLHRSGRHRQLAPRPRVSGYLRPVRGKSRAPGGHLCGCAIDVLNTSLVQLPRLYEALSGRWRASPATRLNCQRRIVTDVDHSPNESAAEDRRAVAGAKWFPCCCSGDVKEQQPPATHELPHPGQDAINAPLPPGMVPAGIDPFPLPPEMIGVTAAIHARRRKKGAPHLPRLFPTPGEPANPVRTYTLLNHESPDFIRLCKPRRLQASCITLAVARATPIEVFASSRRA